MIKELISTRKFKAGYEVRTEWWRLSEEDKNPTLMKSAHTPSGDYIGNPIEAYRMVVKRGIAPELAKKNHTVCSIGFCAKENKWYGWSHRAICGFGIGSKVKKGDCAYKTANIKDLLEDCTLFYTDKNHIYTKSVIKMHEGKKMVYTSWKYDDKIKNKDLRGKITGAFTLILKSFGRGEWTAKTMKDAKQMACDFAESVS